MCTVFAYKGSAIGLPEIRTILKRTERRGPDDERIISPDKDLYLAFQRLSIMGTDERGMQHNQWRDIWLQGYKEEAHERRL